MAQKKFWREQNNLRIAEQRKQFDYYIGDYSRVQKYLEEALNISYSADDIADFQKPVINFTKKLINQLAVVYREPAKRKIVNEDESENEEQTKYYLTKIGSKINQIDNQALRMAKLSNASLTTIKPTSKGIEYLVRPSWLYNVVTEEGNPYKIIEVSYDRYFREGDEDVLYKIFWTDKEHYRAKVDEFEVVGNNTIMYYSKKEPLPSMLDDKGKPTMINPYGIIPYAELVLEQYGDSLWGQGKTDIVSMNEQVNFLLTNLINEQLLLAGAGTVLAVNLGLSAKSNKGNSSINKVRTGRKHPVVVEGVKDTDQEPRLEHVNANPVIDEIRDSIDWLIKLTAVSQGLNPNSFLQDVQATSGYSKIIDSLEQTELRKDDIEPCRVYEDTRFEKSVKINDYYAGTVEGKQAGYKKMPNNIYLAVDFTDPEIPKTADEEIKWNDWCLSKNLISIIDIAREGNPDLNDEGIAEKLDKNKQDNDKYLTRPQVKEPEDMNGNMNNNMNKNKEDEEI